MGEGLDLCWLRTAQGETEQLWEGCGGMVPGACGHKVQEQGLEAAAEQELKGRRWFSEWVTRD